MRLVAIDTVPLAALVVAVLALAMRLAPKARERVDTGRPTPAWDLPARIAVATGLVVGITLFAPTLGPYASAALASFPVFASILGVFEERAIGHAAAVDVMRGLLPGLLGFTAFFVTVALAIEPLGIAVTYALATAAVLTVQAVVLGIVRR